VSTGVPSFMEIQPELFELFYALIDRRQTDRHTEQKQSSTTKSTRIINSYYVASQR